MTEFCTGRRRASAWVAWVLAAASCGPSEELVRLRREHKELSHEVIEVRQYNADLKFRMQLVEARNQILIHLVQGLRQDPEHYQPPRASTENADAALQTLDRDIDALVKSVRHSQSDLEALRAQRAALQAELAQARQSVETARAAAAQQGAQRVGFRALLAPLIPLIHAGRVNVSMQYGQLTLQLPERALFAAHDARLTEEGKRLLERVAEGLRTAADRQFSITGPADEISKRAVAQQSLSAARALAVLAFLTECQVPAANLIAATQAKMRPLRAREPGERYIEITALPKFEELPKLPTSQELMAPEGSAPTGGTTLPDAGAADDSQ